MMALLRGRGAAGVPVAGPLDFAAPPMPPSPNWWMALPPDENPPSPRCTLHALPPADAGAAWDALQAVASRMPRCFPLAAWPERRQAQWVVRSAVLNFPDIVTAEVTAAGGIRLHSRSLIGWSDLGVNRRRVAAWLAALDAALGGGR